MLEHSLKSWSNLLRRTLHMHRCFWLARSSQSDRLSNPDRSRETNGPLLCFVWGYRAGQGVEYAKVYRVIAICWVCERRQSGILFWSLIKCQSLSTLTDLISLLLDATEAAFPHWSPVLNMMPYWRASSDWSTKALGPWLDEAWITDLIIIWDLTCEGRPTM